MTEREAFLAAIRAHPADDTARLVYADWLDEHPERGDLDRATAEFIRMSCKRAGAKVMPRQVYPWLLSKGDDGVVVENWKRLIPGVVKIDADNSRFGQETIGKRDGRVVACSITVPSAPGASSRKPRGYRMSFEFHRGFVISAMMFSGHVAEILAPTLLNEQPFTDLHVVNLWRSGAGSLLRLIESVQGERAAKRFSERLMPG